jgi:WD40 repeat protein
MVASQGIDGVLCLWDLATGKLLRKWEKPADRDRGSFLMARGQWFEQLVFSPDGKLLTSVHLSQNQTTARIR